MARLARIVVSGVAHHVTQRGNRRHEVFFSDEDYAAYVELLTAANGVLERETGRTLKPQKPGRKPARPVAEHGK